MANNVYRAIPALSPSDAERFWQKVDIRGANVCWPWTAGLHHGGYGVFQLAGRTIPATHVALVLDGRDRPQPPSHHALHWPCANRACCNPQHLRWGSHLENIADMVDQGHSMRGERSPNARLTEDDVRAIRQAPEGCTEIAARYGVQKAAISKIRTGRTWQHVT